MTPWGDLEYLAEQSRRIEERDDYCPGPIRGCPCEDCQDEAEAQTVDYEAWQQELTT